MAKRQRADGKMMHEYSLTADDLHGDLNWATLGYEYAAADATPLFIMAIADYVRTTGDLEFLRAHWDQVKKAYEFDRAHDSDGDGVYDNSKVQAGLKHGRQRCRTRRSISPRSIRPQARRSQAWQSSCRIRR